MYRDLLYFFIDFKMPIVLTEPLKLSGLPSHLMVVEDAFTLFKRVYKCRNFRAASFAALVKCYVTGPGAMSPYRNTIIQAP